MRKNMITQMLKASQGLMKHSVLVLAVLGLMQVTAQAATRIKQDNTNDLNLPSSWDTLPGLVDIAQWDATVTGANSTVLGADLTWAGIKIIGPSGAVTIGGGNTLTVGTSGIDLSTATQNLTLSSGLTLQGQQSWKAAASRTLDIAGTFTRTGAYVDFGSFNATAVLGTLVNNNAILGPWAYTGSAATLSYVKSASGLISAYTAATADAGNLASVTSATDNYKYSAAATLGANRTGNTLQYTGAAATTTLGTYSLTLNGLMNSGTGKLTITGTAGSSGLVAGSSGELDVVSNAQGIDISSVISGTGTLVYGGPSAGTLTLSGANSYSGGTVINAGTLIITTAASIGSGAVTVNTGGTLQYYASPALNRNLTLNGGALSQYDTTFSGPITLAANSIIYADGGNFATSTISGAVSGAGGLTHNGPARAGATFLTNASNTYTGPTVINIGALIVKSSLYGNDTSKWTPANITVAANAVLGMSVGGASDFTMAQAATMFTNLTTNVNNNGMRPNSFMSLDTKNASAGTYTFSGVLADSTGTGGGAVNFKLFGTANTTLELTGANTYSGVTMIENNGTLKVSSFNSVNGGNPPMASSSLGRPTNVVNGTILLGTFNWNGNQHPGTTYASGNLTYTGTGETTDRVLALGGYGSTKNYTLDQSGTGLLKFTSNLATPIANTTHNLILTGSTAGTGEFAGVLINPNIGIGYTTTITKNGSGTWTLSAANANTGGVFTVNGGALVLNNATAILGGIGASGGLSALTFNGGVIGLGNGDFTRSLAAAGTVTGVNFAGNGGWAAYGADRLVNLGGALATITWATASTGFNAKTLILGNATATHTVDLQNSLDLGSTAETVQTDNGAAAVDGKLSGSITGTTGALTKTGNGTLVLSGVNNYAGTTTVSAGLLRVNGTNSGTGAFTVSAGGALGGTGSVTGAVTAAVGTASAAGGAINLKDGVVGTLTLGSTLTFSGTAANPNNLYFDLGSGTATTDKILATGAVTASTANGVIINLNQLTGGGAVTNGTYTLIQSSASSTYTGCTLATTNAGGNNYALTISGNNLQVTVAAGNAGPVTPFTYWSGNTAVWNTAQWYADSDFTSPTNSPGFNSNVRIASGAANLTNTLGQDYEINSLTVESGVSATRISGNVLTIDATAANGNTAGNGITVNNTAGTIIASKVALASSQTWTVGSGASLTNSGVVSDFGGNYALAKAGAGTLTLAGVNTLGGSLTISEGTLTIGGAGLLNNGTYAANIADNGIFNYSSSAAQTLSGVMSGTGALVKGGSSTLTLSGANTYTGSTVINAGTLSITTASALGSGPVTINTGGTLQLNANVQPNRNLTLNGGTLMFNSGGSSAKFSGTITLSTNSIIYVDGANFSTERIDASISGVGGLTQNGPGRAGALLLTGANTYTGPTVINNGALVVKSSLYNNDTSKWTPSNITVAANAVLGLSVGGAGEFTMAQAATLFTNLTTAVNNNGMRPNSFMSLDTRNASAGTYTFSGVLADSTGTGGGAVNFEFNGTSTTTLELTGSNTYSGVTMVRNNGTLKVSSFNSVNGGNPPMAI